MQSRGFACIKARFVLQLLLPSHKCPLLNTLWIFSKCFALKRDFVRIFHFSFLSILILNSSLFSNFLKKFLNIPNIFIILICFFVENHTTRIKFNNKILRFNTEWLKLESRLVTNSRLENLSPLSHISRIVSSINKSVTYFSASLQLLRHYEIWLKIF